MSVNRYDASTGELTNIASGQRTWVGTQAAYKAAKQAGTLPNNAIIAITDDEVDHNHYSTEETETGMYWIDGKPIYRKVFTGLSLPNNTSALYNLDTPNIQTIINTSGYITDSDRNFLPLSWVDTGNHIVRTYIALGSGKIVFNSNYDASQAVATVILEYTKSTD